MDKIDYSHQNILLWSWSLTISQTCTKDLEVDDLRVLNPGFADPRVVFLELECCQIGPKLHYV